MKRICLFLLLILISGYSFAQAPLDESKVSKGLQNYLLQYPQSQLCDIYKTCFQDYFGPGHLLADVSVAKDYLLSELNNTKVYGGPLYEPTGIDGNYYRVNILVVAQNIISIDTYMDAFVRSAQKAPKVSVEDWQLLWTKIESIYFNFSPITEQDKVASNAIHQMLDNGKYLRHHSNQFNATYNFHYRIIHKDIFEKEILPLLKK